jgi:hypothetical protein
MAKDNPKLTDDNFKAQWTKENAAHDAQWKVLVRIAEEYGLGFDTKGEVIFEDGANDKAKSNVPNAAPTTIDTTQLVTDIKNAISGVMPKVDTSKLKIDFSPQIHVKNNNDVFDSVTAKWDEWIKKFISEYLKAHGVVQDICFNGEHVYKIEPPIHNNKPTTYTPPKQPSAFTRFRHRLWEDVVSSFWKGFAYAALICCACFAYYEYYYNQKLVRTVKEYMVIRQCLEQNTDYRKYIKQIDTFLQEEDVDKVYEYVKYQKKNAKENQ